LDMLGNRYEHQLWLYFIKANVVVVPVRSDTINLATV